jgi:SAM-dependent methyltransferase
MKPKRILDIGAGANPYIDATDAVDRLTPKAIKKEKDGFFEKSYFYKRKYCKERGYCKKPITTRPKLKNKINYLYNINFNQDKLPYDDNSIDVIVSYHSLQAFGGRHAIKEVYRILKPGGHVDIGWFASGNEKVRGKTSEEEIKRNLLALPKYGFKNIKVFRNAKDNSLYHYQFDKDTLTIIRAYK